MTEFRPSLALQWFGWSNAAALRQACATTGVPDGVAQSSSTSISTSSHCHYQLIQDVTLNRRAGTEDDAIAGLTFNEQSVSSNTIVA
jgi:hypothetical protein